MINPIRRKICLNLFLASFLLCLFLIGLHVSGFNFRGYYTNLICATSFLLSLLFISICFANCFD